jgi:hypothetical protein
VEDPSFARLEGASFRDGRQWRRRFKKRWSIGTLIAIPLFGEGGDDTNALASQELAYFPKLLSIYRMHHLVSGLPMEITLDSSCCCRLGCYLARKTARNVRTKITFSSLLFHAEHFTLPIGLDAYSLGESILGEAYSQRCEMHFPRIFFNGDCIAF